MNRDELLEACFGAGVTYKPSLRIIEMLDETERHVLSHLDLSFRRIVVSLPEGRGQETIMVAALSNVCTDPDHRGKGYASAMVRRALSESGEHRGVRYACLFSDLLGFYARFGFAQVAPEKDPTFLAAKLAGAPDWPAGRYDARGIW